MKNTKLRKQIRSIIQEQIDKNPELTTEGLFNSITNHIKGVLDKAAETKFRGDIKTLAGSGPEGKKAAKHLVSLLKTIDDGSDEFDKLFAQAQRGL